MPPAVFIVFTLGIYLLWSKFVPLKYSHYIKLRELISLGPVFTFLACTKQLNRPWTNIPVTLRACSLGVFFTSASLYR